MGVYSRTPDERAARFIEWHARLIRDPVRRLRYLRQAARLQAPENTPGWPAWVSAAWRSASLLLGLLVFPSPHSSDATAVWPYREPPPLAESAREAAVYPDVWLVEKSEHVEMHSNGLRVEGSFEVSHRPRSGYALAVSEAGERWESLTMPAGIVFHTTESHMVPFEPERNKDLKTTSQALLRYVLRHRAYHFLIDRFGRVHRVVREADAANHAGWSVWADELRIYLNLNDSFLGVAFEAQHESGRDGPPLSPAQIHAGRVLTEMLRSRYRISIVNCVTHAQVSVNPRNARIGYHTDWATNFPFLELGLSDNYQIPLPSMYLFGFQYDPPLDDATAPGLWMGLRAAEDRVLKGAAARGVPAARYRAELQRGYREKLAALDHKGARKETFP